MVGLRASWRRGSKLYPLEGEQTFIYIACFVMNRSWSREDEQKLVELRESSATWRVVAWKLGRTEAATVSHAIVMKSREQEPSAE
jgi:hypothetical protein